VIAVPIFDPDNRPWAALSAAAPWMACSLQEFVAHTAPAVVAAGKNLTKVSRITGPTALAVARLGA